MAQPPLHLVIGNYNTSSWSLRAWLVLRLARLAFIETRIPLRMAETPGRIAAVSPSGKLPVLLAESVPIWDSLAIAEFVAELEPGIWPLDPIARAEARAVSAEMHSGFADLRRLMPMDVVGRFSPPGRLPRGLAADIDRIKAIWGHCRARFAPHGPFLFGAFSIADCMMAPVATRFLTHGVPLDGLVEDYVDSVMSWPDMVTWCDAAAAEQAERDAEGTLGVVAITRPGRVLGRDAIDPAPRPAAADTRADPPTVAAAVPPSPSEPQTTGLDVTVANDGAAAEIVAPMSAAATLPAASSPSSSSETWPVAPSSDVDAVPHAAVDVGDNAPAAGPVEPDRAPVAVDARSEPSPAPDRGEAPSAEPAIADQPTPPRRRLFEPLTAHEAAPADASDEPPRVAVPPEETRGEPSAPDRPVPIAAEDGGGVRPPAPKLGWIRRPVPVEDMAATDALAADEVHPAPQRQPGPPPARPSSPAVKPIGGGILRRR